MRKAALAASLTLLLTLCLPSALLHSLVHAASPRDAGVIPYATDWIYPVGDPRTPPNFTSTEPNGYQITQMFDNSCDPSLGQGYWYAGQYWCGHSGVDLSDLSSGGEVHATAAGLVVAAELNGSYGEMVRIEHVLTSGSIIYSQYEHMEYGSLEVSTGQVVAMGQTIGLVGATGNALGAHLHFEIKQENEDGPGYAFLDQALLFGYYDPLAFVAAHTLEVAPTPTPSPTPVASLTPSTQVLGLSIAAPGRSSAGAGYGDDPEAMLQSFYHQYPNQVTVTAEHLNLRSGSGFSFAPLNSIRKGARLGYLGMTGNGWVHVVVPGDTYGYVARQWVKGKMLPKLPPVQINARHLLPPYAWVLDARYPARNGPMMHDPAIEVLKVGERLSYLGTLGSWDKVGLPSGRIGWVLSWYLHDPAIHVDLSPPDVATKIVPARCPCVQVNVEGLNVREGPGLSAPVIESLPQGTRLSVHGYHGSWAAVTTPDGKQGYVMSTYVVGVGATTSSAAARPAASPPADVQPAATPTPATLTCPCVATTVDGLRLRDGPRLSAPIIESFRQGTRLQLVGYHVSWVAVIAPDGARGYVLGIYVHLEGTASGPGQSPDVGKAAASPQPTPATTPSPTAAPTVTPSADTGATPSPAATATATGQATAPGYRPPFVYVDVGHANIHAAPSLKAIVYISQPRDTRLAVLGTRGPWVHVETQGGVIGWILRELVQSG